MPSADKRARQKENARAARAAREAAEKRRKKMRSRITIGVVAAVVIGLFVIASIAGSKDKKASSTSTTTLPAVLNGCKTATPPKGKQQSFSKPDLVKFDPAKTYVATVDTSCGTFEITLDTKNAPKGAGNFAFLADKGFYDGLAWGRVAKDFVIQGGDYAGDTAGDAGYSLITETPRAGFDVGSVGWAKGNDPAGTTGSEFFVVTGNTLSALNARDNGKIQYGAFGKVTKGLDVAQKIASFYPPDTTDGAPTQPVFMNKITIASSQTVGTTTSSSPTVSPSVSTTTAAPPR